MWYTNTNRIHIYITNTNLWPPWGLGCNSRLLFFLLTILNCLSGCLHPRIRNTTQLWCPNTKQIPNKYNKNTSQIWIWLSLTACQAACILALEIQNNYGIQILNKYQTNSKQVHLWYPNIKQIPDKYNKNTSKILTSLSWTACRAACILVA